MTSSILDRVPSELLALVFQYLSTPDIAASCQVCRRFDNLSSPFFITTITFALRKEAMDNLQSIIDHPVFSRSVTDLVFDASTYDQVFAERRDVQTLQCDRARREPLRVMAEGQVGEGIVDVSSFAHYRMRYELQNSMQKSGMQWVKLCEIVARLPKLRSVTYADYRSMFRPGETDGEGCNRIFGDMLQPWDLRYVHEGIREGLFQMLQIVGQSRKLLCLNIGPLPCIRPWQDCRLDPLPTGRGALQLTSLNSVDKGLFEEVVDVCDSLHSLHLPFHSHNEAASKPRFVQLLKSASPNLRRLSLFKTLSFEDYQSTSLDTWNTIDTRAIQSGVLRLDFPQLAHLELHHMRGISLQHLLDFLARHLSLVSIRLIDCLRLSGEEYGRLACWARDNLLLTGVEMVDCADIQCLRHQISGAVAWLHQPKSGPRWMPLLGTSQFPRHLFPSAASGIETERSGWRMIREWTPYMAEKAETAITKLRGLVMAIEEREDIFLEGRRNGLERTVDILPRSDCDLSEWLLEKMSGYEWRL